MPRTARLVSSSPIVSVSDQPFAGDFRFAYHSWEFFSLLFKELLLSSLIMIHINLVAVLDVRYRQRVQKRLTRLRNRDGCHTLNGWTLTWSFGKSLVDRGVDFEAKPLPLGRMVFAANRVMLAIDKTRPIESASPILFSTDCRCL